MTAYFDIRKCKKQILESGIRSAFTQSPEALMAISKWGWDSLCYMIPGDANPLKMARYRWARPFTGLYDARLFSALRHVDVILACADRPAIENFARRSKGLLEPQRITQFPTRVDTAIFKPLPMRQMRQKLGLDGPGPLVVACGRINKVKGWDLLVQAFALFRGTHRHALLVFVGDGEDRAVLQRAVYKQGLAGAVLITGFQHPVRVVQYLNAADIVVVGSYEEGWSVAMLEALACGRPVVSTDVSGARDMIVEGQNGFIISNRDAEQFASAVEQALVLEKPNPMSLRIAEKYSLVNLRDDLCRLWQPLSFARAL